MWVDMDFYLDAHERHAAPTTEFPLHLLLQTNLLLSYLNLLDATAARAVCRELRDAVTAYVWSDRVPVRAIERWRACFPHATSLFYIGRSKVFYPQRLRILVVFGSKLFSRAFRRLKALTHVTLRSCRGVTAVLPLLSRLKTLDLSYCRFRGDALRELTAVESLDDDCSFRIIAAARTLTLRAHTSAERDEWVEGLRHRIGGPRIGGAGRRASLPVRPLSLLRTALPEASGSEEVVDAEEMEERVDAFFSRRRGEVPEQHIEPKSPVPSGADATTAVHVTGDISPRTSPPASARRFSFGGTLMWKPSVRG